MDWGKMGGEGIEAEDAEAEGVEPVGQRRFFEVADAVDVQGDKSPVRAMWRAALAWVASASSSSGGAKSEAKKMTSQRPNRMATAVERRGLSVRKTAGDSVSGPGGLRGGLDWS